MNRLEPYRAYKFKNEQCVFEFVCINQIDFAIYFLNEYRIMYINYKNDLAKNILTEKWSVELAEDMINMHGGDIHSYGEIDGWLMELDNVSNINNKSKRIQNAIMLAKLMNI